MCGRFNLTDEAQDIAKIFGLKTDLSSTPRYNIAPSQNILAVRQNEDGQTELVYLKWGLLPFWIKDKKKSLKPINAKAESASEKPYFRSAFKNRRCLIPANGFYEWQKRNGQKQPFLIHHKKNRLLFFAGLWEHWLGDDGEVIESVCILTTNALGHIADIHDRMPVICGKEFFASWLDIHYTDKDFIKDILDQSFIEETTSLESYPISTLINSVRNDAPECVKKLDEQV